jgi:peptidoglycan/LPS O-acetylase OafA/YrhL
MAERTVYFNEIVGLRIYLALWVAVGHGLQLAGVHDTNPLLQVILDGHAAVVVFMIVSGFVIANLLLTKQESYPRYITRRFFRLYPAYVLCAVAGYLLADNWSQIMRDVPWAADPRWTEYAASIFQLEREVRDNFWPHLGFHAVMLHGLVPAEVLHRAPMTFLPAAWSISLEWQFYLVAPLLLSVARHRRRLPIIVGGALVLFAAYHAGLLGHYDIGASLAGATPYFLVGIASRLGFDKLAALNISPLTASVVAVFAAASMLRDPLPFLVWAVFYCYLLWHRNAPITGRAFRALTLPKPFQLLGEASYSLYLAHRPVQVALASVAMGLMTVSHASMMAIQLVAVAIAIPISLLMYFTVERGGIALGRSLAQRLPGSGPPAHPDPAPVALGKVSQGA